MGTDEECDADGEDLARVRRRALGFGFERDIRMDGMTQVPGGDWGRGSLW